MMKGYLRKVERRRELGQKFYRQGKTTLKTRIKKKLIGKTTWYKENKRDIMLKNSKSDAKRGPKKDKNNSKQTCHQSQVKAVMFVPCQGAECSRVHIGRGYRLPTKVCRKSRPKVEGHVNQI